MKVKILVFLKSYLGLFIILSIFAFGYIWKIGSVPTNITGDENTFLGNIYQILYSPNVISPFELMGDYSQSAANFYFMAFFVKIIGLNNTIVGLRLSNIIWSLGTLVVFYYISREKTSKGIALISTILLGSNIWFINFTRNGFNNMEVNFWGLLLFLFLEKGLTKLNKLFIILSGFFAGICFFGYLAGKVYILSAFLYLFVNVFTNGYFVRTTKLSLLFLISFCLTILPFIPVISKNSYLYLLRSKTTYVLNGITDTETAKNLLIEQTKENINGLFLFDGKSIGKGVENMRYSPSKTPLIHPILRFIFFLGIIISLIKIKDYYLWWFSYLISFFGISVLTIDTPNPARAITILPFVFLLIAISLENVVIFLKKRMSCQILYLSLFILTILIATQTTLNYWNWALTDEVRNVRQPAIDYSEFSSWQNYQINRVKSGLPTITNHKWYEIRNSYVVPHQNP